jgi:SAM-dependent methyltransferase
MVFLPTAHASSLQTYEQVLRSNAEVLSERRALERAVLPKAGEPAFKLEGWCALCGRPTEFQVSFMYAPPAGPDGVQLPNWREHLDCKHCSLVNRVRASMQLFLQQLRPERTSSIYITEEVTRTYQWLRERFDNVVGSEFVDPAGVPGSTIKGVRHEDLQRLSFADQTFDFILSFDVLEHVPSEERAFSEMFRCLRPGGSTLFTAPFSINHEANVVRAVMHEDGSVEHRLPPEYHGNPVDPEGGALAYRYFGWQMLRQLERIGFESTEAHFYWSRALGYLGAHQVIVTAKRPR